MSTIFFDRYNDGDLLIQTYQNGLPDKKFLQKAVTDARTRGPVKTVTLAISQRCCLDDGNVIVQLGQWGFRRDESARGYGQQLIFVKTLK